MGEAIAVLAIVLVVFPVVLFLTLRWACTPRPVDWDFPPLPPLDPPPDVFWARVREAERLLDFCREQEADSYEREWLR